MSKIDSLQDLIDSEDYQIYKSETLLNPQYHIINNTGIDVDRMFEANKNCEFGVTHQDVIDNVRDYLDNNNIDEETKEKIEKEIDEKESYLIENGSINEFI